jgi:hypothetical protein
MRDGRYLLRLKTRWRDGTTRLLFEPIELMERLAAQIPKPRVNLVLSAGVLAPQAKLRARAVAHDRPEPLPELSATETQTRSERDSWSELMRATFGLDVLECRRCGGRLKYIATILDNRVARRIPRAPRKARPCATRRAGPRPCALLGRRRSRALALTPDAGFDKTGPLRTPASAAPADCRASVRFRSQCSEILFVAPAEGGAPCTLRRKWYM